MDRQRPPYAPLPPQSQPRPPFNMYTPGMPQQPPPLRQPPGDPFSRHDPFLSKVNDNRDPHLPHPPYRPLDAPNNQPRFEPLQAASHPPPSPFHPGPLLFRDDSRRSVPAGYPGGNQERANAIFNNHRLIHRPGPIEPPPHLMHHQQQPPRHMPPPASSPKESPIPPHLSQHGRGPVPTPPGFAPGREGGQGYMRPGSSMSLSHIMGVDAGAPPPSRQQLWSPSASLRPPLAGNGPYNQPPSPQHSSRSMYEPRQRTPERRSESQYGGSYGRPPHNIAPPPSDHGFGRLLQHPPQQHGPPQSMPPRPFSQPTAMDNGGRPGQRPSFEHPSLPQSRNNYENASIEKVLRERAMSDLDGRKTIAPMGRTFHEQPYHQGYGALERQPLPAYQNPQSEPPQSEGYRRIQHSGPERRMPSPPTMHGAMNGPPPPFGYATAELGPGPGPAILQEQQHPNERSMGRPDQYESRASLPTPGPYGNGYPPEIRGNIVDGGEHNAGDPRKLIDDHNHRSLLGLNNEYARRIDRASPLPQAVQGAQSQPPDAGRDPGIKSEFGRMFSGLGSGIGSTPQPAHTPLKRPLTPSRTPAYEALEAEHTIRRPIQDVDVMPRPTTGGLPVNARSAKRRYDDETRIEGNGIEGRATPVTTTATKGKRNKYIIPPGHHHHPLPVSHHHHRKPEDVITNSQPLSRRPSATSFSNFKQLIPPTQSSTTPIPHHHHHHHPPPHHHHHAHKPQPAPHRPITTIMTKSLVRDVSKHPRNHLGSQLYSPNATLPHLLLTNNNSSHVTYDNVPNPMPRFEGKENCTFTIRVPRYYLTHEKRMAICSSRRLWGTDVYTDDSDPVVAAIHSGWLRGAWAEDVDENLLSLELPPPPTTQNGTETPGANPDNGPVKRYETPPPTGPVLPPTEMDLHLTILILPPLERYASSVWHGIKSRLWGDNHDGMSFKIERMEWVDEGVAGRNEERGGAARRKRLARIQAEKTWVESGMKRTKHAASGKTSAADRARKSKKAKEELDVSEGKKGTPDNDGVITGSKLVLMMQA